MDTDKEYPAIIDFEEIRQASLAVNPNIHYNDCVSIYNLLYPPTVADNQQDFDAQAAKAGEAYWAGVIKQEEENSMFDTCEAQCAPRKSKFTTVAAPIANAQVIAAVPVESTQRDYAIERIRKIGNDKLADLRVQFHMDPQRPQTWNQLKAFIDSGEFTIDQSKVDGDEAQYHHLTYGVTFGKPADKVGFEAAREQLKNDTQKALDKATLGDIAGLEALIDGMAEWKYTAK